MQKLFFKNGNGVEIDLTSGDFGITNWEGFSADGLNIQSQQVPMQDGGVFLDALLEQRELTITLAMNDEGDLERRYRNRRQLIATMNPKAGEGILTYTNDFISKQIHVIPELPVFENHNSNDRGTPKASLTWVACNPYWEDVEETSVIFSYGRQPKIENNGDVSTSLKMLWNSEYVKNPKVINKTTGKRIGLNGEFSGIAEIDTNVGNKSVETTEYKYVLNNCSLPLNNIHCFGESLFVAVGDKGLIVFSTDCESWTIANSGTEQNLYDVTYSRDLEIYLAVGSKGIILKSSNIIDWEYVQGGDTVFDYNSVTYFSDISSFFITGNYAGEVSNVEILKSSDGLNWERVYHDDSYDDYIHLSKILYSTQSNEYIAIGNIKLTSDNGTNWTQQEMSYSLSDLIYIQDLQLFVGVGRDGVIVTSEDCSSWTSRTSGTNNDLNRIIYSEDLQIIVVVGNGIILTSVDAINWNLNNSNFENLLSVAYSKENNIFIATGENFSILESSNGLDWNIIKKGEELSYKGIAYSDTLGLYVAITNGRIGTSEDGKNWTWIQTNYSLSKIVYSQTNRLFVIVGAYGVILTSSDAKNWTPRTSGTDGNLNKIIYVESLNLFVAIGSSSGVTSSDGINWNIRNFSGIGVVYSKKLELLLAMNSNGNVMTSSDGVTWTYHNTNLLNAELRCLEYSETTGIFLAAGFDGRIYKSVNGLTWESISYERYVYYSYLFYSYLIGKFFIVWNNERTYKSKILFSYDGVVWELSEIGVQTELNFGLDIPSRKNTIFVGTDDTVIETQIEGNENIINRLTPDSSLNMELTIGENKMYFSRSEGDMNIILTYRQKYLGV